MKVVIVLVLAGIALLEARTLQKRALCQTDSDCPKNHCCVNFGLFKTCHEYVSEGSLCTIRNAVSCGCAPGLDCVKSGLITKRCMDVTPGSGDY